MINKLLAKNIFHIAGFKASTKVHMQRDVMREIDARLVKYSQRGILLSLTIFTLALSLGEYYTKQPAMALFLAGGLILMTLIRGCFLIKFESLYAQGPARWRQMFFFTSMLGSSWWGIIVACVTWEHGLLYETPILWLYTVAFFAGSIYVYAPFQRFLQIYMFVAFIPCASIAILCFEPISILYGLIMMILYLLLCRQGRFIGQNYWDKLQANYDLLRRAKTLEAEKITTESSLNHRDVLFNNLTLELKSSIQEIVGSLKILKYSDLQDEEEQLVLLSEQKAQQQIDLLRNVAELSSISANKVLLEHNIIDPRYHIEQALHHVSIIAHKKNIELFSSFACDFPLRVRGDAERFEQIIGNLASSACQFCCPNENGELVVSSSFRGDDEPGTLKISIVNSRPMRTAEAEENINAAFSPHYATDIKLGLSLAIVKGLAKSMDGDAGAYYNDDGALIFWVSIRLTAVTAGRVQGQASPKLSGKKALLYQAPSVISETFCATLHRWGLDVDATDNEEHALSLLEKAQHKSPYHLLIVYTHLDNISDGLSLSKKVAEHDSLHSTSQIIILSQLQNKMPCVEEHFLTYVNVGVIYKPIQYRKLHKMIKDNFIDGKKEASHEQEKHSILTGKHLLVFQQEDIDVAIIKSMAKKIGCTSTVASSLEECLSLLSEQSFDAFICESHLENEDLESFIEQARALCRAKTDYVMPILGASSHELDGEETHCLALGMEHYIDSPVDIDDLEAVLKRFVGRAFHMREQGQ